MKYDRSNVSVHPNYKWKIEAKRAYVYITYMKYRERMKFCTKASLIPPDQNTPSSLWNSALEWHISDVLLAKLITCFVMQANRFEESRITDQWNWYLVSTKAGKVLPEIQ